MECHRGENIPFGLYTPLPVRYCQPYELLHCNTNICDVYAKAMFTTVSCLLVPMLTALRLRKNTFSILGFMKVWNKALNKIREMFVRNIFSWLNRTNIGTAPSICLAVTPLILGPKKT
jgi:hypothetical protein